MAGARWDEIMNELISVFRSIKSSRIEEIGMYHSLNDIDESITDSVSNTTRSQGHGTDDGTWRLTRDIAHNLRNASLPQCQIPTIPILLHHP